MYGAVRQFDDSDWITSDGYRSLCDDLDRLRAFERPAAAEQVRLARMDGELPDNPGLRDTLEQQARIEHRIAVLRSTIARARVARVSESEHASIGMQIVIRDIDSNACMTVELVGEHEAEADRGRISIASPIGAAINGLPVGGRGIATTPRGPRRLEIVELRGMVSGQR